MITPFGTGSPLKDPSAEFDQFVTLVRRCGYADFYYRIRHIYWTVDEFKYWTMGWAVAETTVINRARIGAPEPRRTGRLAGWIEVVEELVGVVGEVTRKGRATS